MLALVQALSMSAVFSTLQQPHEAGMIIVVRSVIIPILQMGQQSHRAIPSSGHMQCTVHSGSSGA